MPITALPFSFIPVDSGIISTPSQAPTGTSTSASVSIANQNIAGGDSGYVAWYKGNMDSDQWAKAVAIPVGSRWTCDCPATTASSGTVASVAVVGDWYAPYLNIYLVDSNGEPVIPNSGSYYTIGYNPSTSSPGTILS